MNRWIHHDNKLLRRKSNGPQFAKASFWLCPPSRQSVRERRRRPVSLMIFAVTLLSPPRLPIFSLAISLPFLWNQKLETSLLFFFLGPTEVKICIFYFPASFSFSELFSPPFSFPSKLVLKYYIAKSVVGKCIGILRGMHLFGLTLYFMLIWLSCLVCFFYWYGSW